MCKMKTLRWLVGLYKFHCIYICLINQTLKHTVLSYNTNILRLLVLGLFQFVYKLACLFFLVG